MATQGLISVLEDDGVVKQKIVIGCDGYRAKDAARRVVSERAETLEEIYEAVSPVVGCQECLVVMDSERILYRGLYRGTEDEFDDPSNLYRNTFANAKFNPRWKHGTAAYTVFIHKGDVGEYVPSDPDLTPEAQEATQESGN